MRWPCPLADREVDVTHASLLIHHLDPDDAVVALGEMRRVSRLGVVINDLRRGVAAVPLHRGGGAGVQSRPCTRATTGSSRLVVPTPSTSWTRWPARPGLSTGRANTALLAARDDGLPMTRATLDCDVLVVGAGPAGSALAAALAAAGRDVLLVEAHAHPRPKACAEYASPRIVEELRPPRPAPEQAWQVNALGAGRHAGDPR